MTSKEHGSEKASAVMPRDVSSKVGPFDRFATKAADFVSRAPFFFFCVLLVLVWAPSFLFFPIDTWQLIINTTTTIITFLMVALLQNTQSRNDAAIQHKLNALASGLADLMEHVAKEDEQAHRDLDERREELRRAVGLEEDESA
ncbi:low affinity iron permease family protein [Glycomyces sp. A-F 0318]|uniref:low affinity iron permease family protein n=1 Tax=Glycomyces amatae TaxID=2881355 RepID=UPI001E4737D1|nr:low affinity iron permease family protein [Glycomyces amatae]MCD0444458.1 low affinity iron permease family protein [Glycomyces amatae]